MAKKATKKAAPKKNTKAVVRKVTKTVSEKVVKPIKLKTPTESDRKVFGAFDYGIKVGIKKQKYLQDLQNTQTKIAPAITARLSFELDEANDCKINVSGDFNVILKKMHEIQNQSITVDKGEFFAAAAKLMKGEQK